tara:strand:- start:117 stop:1703 length:1587 start_codon:yes stop_codon:yes gene_type:complete
MAKSDFKLEMLQDFSGGLNLRSDQFNLAPTESPAMLNVDVDPRGGIKMRNGVTARNTTALQSDVTGLSQFTPDGGVAKIICSYGTTVAQSATADFTTINGVSVGNGDRLYGQTTNNKFYGVSGTASSFVYDGSTASNLAANLNGSSGNYPVAKYTCHWNNFAWTGSSTEGGTEYKNRVRWSKLNDPESWVEYDYVDVNVGERGDEVSALVPFADRLLIFKTNSIHAIYGSGTDSFQLVPLTQDVGSVSMSSPVSTPYGVYFWYDRQGVWLFDGQQFVWVFEKLQPAIDDGRLQFNRPPQLAWFKNRLYVSVDWSDNSSSNTARRVLIFDPTLGMGGAWTMTDIDADTMLTYAPPNAQQSLMAACQENTGQVVVLEQSRENDFYGGASTTHIDSSYTTSWLVGRNPIVRKRWGKPRVVTSSDSSVALNADLYVDYDGGTAKKSMTFGVQTGPLTHATWDNANNPWSYDPPAAATAFWAGDPNTNITQIERLPTLGTAKAIQMKITGPTNTDEAWEVNAMAFTYLHRRLR